MKSEYAYGETWSIERDAPRWPNGERMYEEEETAVSNALMDAKVGLADPGILRDEKSYSLSQVIMDMLWIMEEIEDNNDDFDLKAKHLSLAFLGGAQWEREKNAGEKTDTGGWLEQQNESIKTAAATAKLMASSTDHSQKEHIKKFAFAAVDMAMAEDDSSVGDPDVHQASVALLKLWGKPMHPEQVELIFTQALKSAAGTLLEAMEQGIQRGEFTELPDGRITLSPSSHP